jgi:hypothetical protein
MRRRIIEVLLAHPEGLGEEAAALAAALYAPLLTPEIPAPRLSHHRGAKVGNSMLGM